METGVDSLDRLCPDVLIKIFKCLEDISDLVRVSAVSKSARGLVIANGLSKELFLRLFPHLSGVDSVVGSEKLEQHHNTYAFLVHGCTSFPVRQLIQEPISASSTNNYRDEGIENTLVPSDTLERRITSYWSSEGQRDPAVPETLTYKLDGDRCLINEINIRPFQAFFEWGIPIYSAGAVRFRMGHMDANNRFVWTYTSEEFPMVQENRLQNFRLPEPVLCIGGIMQVELLGRVQTRDDLF